MTPEQLAEQFGHQIIAHRDKLATKADDAVQVMYALHKSATVLETQRAEHREAANAAQAEWHGRGSERFEFRSGRINLRMRQTRDVAEDAERAVTSAMSSVSSSFTAAERLVTEYSNSASNVLRAGVSATGVGSTAALMQAVAKVSDELEPHYRRQSAANLRTAYGELAEAARRLRKLTKELTTDGFADPGDKERKHGDGKKPGGSKKVGNILQAARKQIGYQETGDDINKFGPPGQPWCSYFATDMWRKAGVNIPNYGFTGDVYRWGQEHGKAYGAKNLDEARPGDVLLFGTGPENTSTSKHIGIVEKVDGNTVWTIEGNAGPGTNQVVRVKHTLSSATFYGGVHP